MNLFRASNQWSTRPADERFWTLEEALEVCSAYHDRAVEAPGVALGDFRAEAVGGDITVRGKTGAPAKPSHFAFGQLARLVGAPASYLRELPATLAVQNLNHGLRERGQDESLSDLSLLFHAEDDHLVLRAATSERYARVWNDDIIKRLLPLVNEQGWQVPPARPATENDPRARPATEADCLANSRRNSAIAVRPGDIIAPAGVYASDKDIFLFLVNERATLENPTSPTTPLSRGFFCWNSEVGDCSFGVTTFLYDAVCGNHIVWGAKDVRELRVRHIGEADERTVRALSVELRKYADDSASEDEARIKAAQSFVLGVNKDEVVDAVLAFAKAKSVPLLTRANVSDAYDVAEATPRYGAPNRPWAIAQGLTELSQKQPHADKRVALDKAAGRVLQIAF